MLLFLSACQSEPPANVYAPSDDLAAARSAPVPIPATTPFDATPQLRAEYLAAYQDGYRSGLTGMNIQFRKPPDGASDARITGWRDGAAAGLKEHFYQKSRR